MKYRVLFAHGSGTGPNGTKIKLLTKVCEKLGFESESIDYSDLDDADERVARLLAYPKDPEVRLILVGSSMGGYVSTVAAMSRRDVASIFLMAPALYIKGRYRVQEYDPNGRVICVVHGTEDDVIPFENSIRFARSVKAELHLVWQGHRLESDLELLGELFELFLHRTLRTP